MSGKKAINRTCIGCGEIKEKKDLIRVVKNNENEIFVDKTGRANGRGAYICDNVECFKLARKNKGWDRSFKMKINDEIYDLLEGCFDEK